MRWIVRLDSLLYAGKSWELALGEFHAMQACVGWLGPRSHAWNETGSGEVSAEGIPTFGAAYLLWPSSQTWHLLPRSLGLLGSSPETSPMGEGGHPPAVASLPCPAWLCPGDGGGEGDALAPDRSIHPSISFSKAPRLQTYPSSRPWKSQKTKDWKKSLDARVKYWVMNMVSRLIRICWLIDYRLSNPLDSNVPKE